MNKKLELKDTIALMTSSDYKQRFIAEYWQTKIRYEKLKDFSNRIELANLDIMSGPNHDVPYNVLREQQRVMSEYLHILELRAIIENIDLYEKII